MSASLALGVILLLTAEQCKHPLGAFAIATLLLIKGAIEFVNRASDRKERP